jgi:hypothetical protein
MKYMKRLLIVILLIGTLLFCGIVMAEKPIKEPVDKMVIIHYNDKVNSKDLSATDQSTLYKLLGVKWKTLPVKYYINPANSNLGSADVTSSIIQASQTWDSGTSKSLFQFVQETTSSDTSYDNQNTVFWGPITDTNVIAMTNIWYTRYTKEIVDTDIQMNSNNAWGIDPDGEGPTPLTNAFDVQNIITHEMGHVCGLGDLYNNPSRELTMYGYSRLGEVKKDSLGTGDILGLQKIYGQ